MPSPPWEPLLTHRFQILATSDLHGQVTGWDYVRDRPGGGPGFAALAARIEALLPEMPGLVVDNGDLLQGTELADHALSRGEVPNPVLAAAAGIGIEAAAIGNHEFDFGVAALREAMRGAPFPLLCANLFYQDGRPFCPGTTVLDRTVGGHVLRVGLFGLCPPQVLQWDAAQIAGALRAEGLVEAARGAAERLRSEGADLVIALAHTGLRPPGAEDAEENAAAPIAALAGIDAVVAGHIHGVFPGPGYDDLPQADPATGTVAGTPVVMPGAGGSHLGRIVLELARSDGGWAVRSGQAEVIPITDAGPAAPALARGEHAAARARMAARIGTLAAPLDAPFQMLGIDPVIPLLSRAVRDRLAPVLDPGPPLLCAVAPMRAGRRSDPDDVVSIPAGPVLRRHAAELYPFVNTLTVLETDGAGVLDWLERAAAVFSVIAPGQRGPLLDPRCPAYNFDVLDGLTYEIDLTAPPRFSPHGRPLEGEAGRVRRVRLEGRPLDPRDPVRIATNGYRAGGGGGFGAAMRAASVYDTPETWQEIVADWLRSQGPIRPEARAPWRFAPPAEPLEATFTGPARPQGALPPGVTDQGPGPAGGRRYLLSLAP